MYQYLTLDATFEHNAATSTSYLIYDDNPLHMPNTPASTPKVLKPKEQFQMVIAKITSKHDKHITFQTSIFLCM